MWMGVERAQEDRYVTRREAQSIDLSSGICHTLGKHSERVTGIFFPAIFPRCRSFESFFLLSPIPSRQQQHLIVLRYVGTGSRVNSPSLVTRRIR